MPVPIQRDKLYELNLEVVAGVSHCFEARPNARSVTMMVGAENVDEMIEVALSFVEMVGDIGGEVSFHTVFTYDDTIFFVAEFHRRKPGCAISLVEDVTLLENGERVINAIVLY